MTLGLLISGNLGILILNDILINPELNVLFVFTDSKSTFIIKNCKERNIPVFIGNPRNGKAESFLTKQSNPLLIISVNYLFIVNEDVIQKATKYAVNIHGSLLPKYRGRTPHIWAIINNENLTGVSLHLLTKDCDEGDIIIQKNVPILNNYTGQDLLNIFNTIYPLIVAEFLHKVKHNEVELIKQDNTKASYFEKRTSEDGRINFEWQKERIYNWVRALSKPYPGAFAYIGANKIIIHKLEIVNLGFKAVMQNGLVLKLEDDGINIKVQNGVVKISQIETNYKIKEGDILL